MLDCFARLTPGWLNRAGVYTGSVGPFGRDFRFRCRQDSERRLVHAAVYSRVCFESADDVEEQDFPWDDPGVAALREWLQDRYDAFAAAQGSA